MPFVDALAGDRRHARDLSVRFSTILSVCNVRQTRSALDFCGGLPTLSCDLKELWE